MPQNKHFSCSWTDFRLCFLAFCTRLKHLYPPVEFRIVYLGCYKDVPVSYHSYGFRNAKKNQSFLDPVVSVSCMERRTYQSRREIITATEASKNSYGMMAIFINIKYSCIYSYTNIQGNFTFMYSLNSNRKLHFRFVYLYTGFTQYHCMFHLFRVTEFITHLYSVFVCWWFAWGGLLVLIRSDSSLSFFPLKTTAFTWWNMGLSI